MVLNSSHAGIYTIKHLYSINSSCPIACFSLKSKITQINGKKIEFDRLMWCTWLPKYLEFRYYTKKSSNENFLRSDLFETLSANKTIYSEVEII